jgi:pyruvate kinase
MAYLDPSQLQALLQDLSLLRSEMLELETSGLAGSAQVRPDHSASARNLMHYLALRRHDIRELQAALAGLGLSSLGRTESHVLNALQATIEVLQRLSGVAGESSSTSTAPSLNEGTALLRRNTEALLGPAPGHRRVRIMVTMPSEAATD